MIKRCRSRALSVFLLAPVFLQSQVPQEHESNYQSLNREFTIQVKGLAYEGFIGPQTLVLKNSVGTVLWTVTRNIWSPPAVSNSGIVALLASQIDFYDKQGNPIGSFVPMNPDEQFWTGCADCSPGHEFSPNGEDYYTIVSDPSGRYLLSLTISGKEQWRFGLPKEAFIGIDVRCNMHPFHRGIIVTCTADGPYFRTYCFLIDKKGEQIAKYQSDNRPPFFVSIQDSVDFFSVQHGDSLTTYSLESGKMLKHKFAPLKRKRPTGHK